MKINPIFSEWFNRTSKRDTNVRAPLHWSCCEMVAFVFLRAEWTTSYNRLTNAIRLWSDYFTPCGRWAKYCDQCVCLSARISQKPPVRIHQISCYLWLWLGPPLTTLQYVMHFLFLWMTSCFHIIGQWARIKHYIMFRRVRQMAAPGAKSDVCGSLVLILRRIPSSEYWRRRSGVKDQRPFLQESGSG